MFCVKCYGIIPDFTQIDTDIMNDEILFISFKQKLALASKHTKS